MKIRKEYPLSNIIFILSLSLICIFYFIYFQNLVPAKFYFDSSTVMRGIVDSSSVDPSYRNVAIFFKLLGVTSSNGFGIYIHLLSWIFFQFFLLIILRVNEYHSFSFIQILFIAFFSLMYGIYFDTLSKDLVLITLLLFFINLYIYKNNFIYLILFIGLYTLYFRNYWIILLIFSLFIYIMRYFMKHFKIKRMIMYIIFLFIITIIVYDIFNGDFITNSRVNVNMTRIGVADTKSMIQNILPNTNILNDIINYFYVLVSLIIPLQGIPSLNTIVYYFWIIGLIILMVKYKNYLNKKLLLLLFVYINMQALFEPDFGSVFRHQLALFPLIYYLLNNIKIKETRN